MFLFLLLFLVLIVILYKYATWNNNYWKDKGVPSDPPSLFFGCLKDNIFLKKHLGEVYSAIYRKYEDLRYVGVFKFKQPQLVIRDPEIIKDILVKDFNHFQNNDVEVGDNEIALKKNPFVLKGEQWKHSRTQLLQCFTSAKMKSLVSTMETVSERFAKYIEEQMIEKVPLNAKNVTTRYTVESVVNSAFGLEANCFESGKSNFMEMSYKIFYPSFLTSIKIMWIILLPSLSKYLELSFVPKDVAHYFVNLINDLVKYRNDNNVNRNDFLNILLQMQEKYGDDYNMEDVISHSMALFTDGTETSANTMTFIFYEIAANLDVQEKLRVEIDTIKRKYGGHLTYEGIQEMTYLDCVVNESLRMHPPGLTLMKVCTQDYTLPSPYKTETNNTTTITAGTSIIIPLYALHYDKKYFPEPERFDPERFNDENKQKITKFTYLPFGDGQRACLGQRFAYLQMKIGIATIISNFELRVNKKTRVPLEIDPKYFMLLAKGGIWLDFRKRTS